MDLIGPIGETDFATIFATIFATDRRDDEVVLDQTLGRF